MTSTEPDPAARRDETRAALADPVNREAYDRCARGEVDALTDEERDALRRARELTGTPAPGFPLPVAATTEGETR